MMHILYPAFLVVCLGGGPVAIGAWALDHWRARRRNARGGCACCGQPFRSSNDDRYLIHGRMTCSTCATRARRRMAWHFGILAGAAAFATGCILLAGSGPLIVLPLGSVAGGLIGALRMMKVANDRARLRLMSGVGADLRPHTGI